MQPLDWIVLLNLGYALVTLFVNPVGFFMFGSQTVGARTYFNIGIAAVAYWVIVRSPDTSQSVRRAPYFIAAGALVISLLYLSSYAMPSLPFRLPYLYALLDVQTFYGALRPTEEIRRFQRLMDGGLALALVLCAYYPPQKLLNPSRGQFYILVLALIGILASGFRSAMLTVLAALALGAWLYRRSRDLVVMMVLGACLLGLLAFGQGRFYDLPLAAQRTLTFLPGKWSPIVVQDATWSTQGRFKWWKDIVENDVIKNWWLGDGFGASLSELSSLDVRRSSEESVMVSGSFHNGPLTTIRYAGIFGLILFYTLMITSAVAAVRHVRLCRNSPLLPVAIYLAIQLIWFPVHFTLVFGSYNADFPQQIFLAGLLRLVIRLTSESTSPSSALTPASQNVGLVRPALQRAR